MMFITLERDTLLQRERHNTGIERRRGEIAVEAALVSPNR
jgi:hypothetical protein